MCDYSLHHLKSRPANVGDKLTTRQFSFGTAGFSAPEDINVAVCVLRGGSPKSFAATGALDLRKLLRSARYVSGQTKARCD